MSSVSRLRFGARRQSSWVLVSLTGGTLALLFAVSCEISSSADSASGGGLDGAYGDGDDGLPDGQDPLPPEVELEETFKSPVVSGKYLWTANPETNKVARINAATLDIEVLFGGHAPSYLAALPAGATPGGALILNERSGDASMFLMDEDERLLPHARLPVQEGASAWAVGDQGAFAIAWSRSAENLLDPRDGYQDLTVFDFRRAEPSTTTLSVGFRPSQVVINDDETRAFVVSGPGISVIALGNDVGVVRELFLEEESAGRPRDVSFTPDGRVAFVRIEGESEVLLVDTETNERASVKLSGPVTDLDLSADGSTAVAVVRGTPAEEGDPSGLGGMGGASSGGGSSGGASSGGASSGGAGTGGSGAMAPVESHIALLPTATIFGQPLDFTVITTPEIVGSVVVAEDASQVLLFSTATSSTRLTILTTGSMSMRTVDLKAPVQAAFLSDDAAFSVVLMSSPNQSLKGGAFALVPVDKALPPRIQGTDTMPQFVSISAAAGRALVTTEATPSRKATAYFGRFPGLQLDRIELPSQPLASGLIPEAGQAFVAQEHAEGRVTFVALETGVGKTVTGFELSSKVVQ